jgi:uncharacterized protein YacL
MKSVRQFDVVVALATFHAGVLTALAGILISIFFLNYPFNAVVSIISIIMGVILMYKGYRIGISLKRE